MKILFIENMYRTYFWEAIAKKLEKDGFQTAWIVQNHFFTPIAKEVIKIPYPKPQQLIKYENHSNKHFSFIKSTDRIINYFDGNDTHYPYYYQKFIEALDKIRPDLVIGESTLFHELMIIDICKKRDILYLHPSSSSYPPKRFSFYKNDTKVPFTGEKHIFDTHKYDEYIDVISNRKILPDYMKKKPTLHTDRLFPKIGSFQDKINRTKAYLMGEKFNTPSPFRKIRENRKVKQLLKQWEKISVEISKIPKNKKIILYPLQMQPEANLDVWGNTYQNQTNLIKNLTAVIPNNWIIVVKTNPKSKYEMSAELLKLLEKEQNVIALDRNIGMKEIFTLSDLIVTVTGTIAIEAVLSSKPLALFGTSIVSQTNGVKMINNYEKIKVLIEEIENSSFKLAQKEDKRELIHKMMTTSYSGIVSDPASNPNCLLEDNINNIYNPLLNILEEMNNK